LCTIINVNNMKIYLKDAKSWTYSEYLSCGMRLLNPISRVWWRDNIGIHIWLDAWVAKWLF